MGTERAAIRCLCGEISKENTLQVERSSDVPVSGVCLAYWRNSKKASRTHWRAWEWTEGVGMDGGASVGAAWRDDLGPLVKALDLTLSKKASQ